MKIFCLYDDTLDGWLSAGILKLWFYKKYPKYKEVVDIDSVTVEINHGTNIEDVVLYFKKANDTFNLEDYKHIDVIYLLNATLDKDVMLNIVCKYELDFVWITNHNYEEVWTYISNNRKNGEYLPNGYRDDKLSSCEATFNYCFPHNNVPNLVTYLGKYCSNKHIGTELEQDIKNIYVGAIKHIHDYKEAYYSINIFLEEGSNINAK